MRIRIIGAESLGVRSMCCVVETANRRVVIDPGVALAPLRFGLPPHPVELKRAAEIRDEILTEIGAATDIVISHFHGDHAPLAEPDPSQVPLLDFINHLGGAKIWVKSRQGNTRLMDKRLGDFVRLLGERVFDADGKNDGELAFSLPVLHGKMGRGTVMMTTVVDSEMCFVHASDIQLLDDEAVFRILSWRPDIVFVDGPPIYLGLQPIEHQRAIENGLKLARGVERLIVDHHLLRSATGLDWLRQIGKESGNRVISAAEWDDKKTLLLEAHRRALFRAVNHGKSET
ncbi:MAG: hypothetical protein ABIK42_03115 [candidate division WOR-3 bacterium]